METLQGRNDQRKEQRDDQRIGQNNSQQNEWTAVHAAEGVNTVPTTVRMRCPCCKKVYTAETAELLTEQVGSQYAKGSVARFECTSCKALFNAVMPDERTAKGRATIEGAVMAETFLSSAAPEPRVKPPARGVAKTEVVGARRAPLNQPMFSCPKCRTVNSRAATECRSCGIVFVKYRSEVEKEKFLDEGEVTGRPELVAMWKELIEDYENMVLHERFIEACRASESLGFASHKYARVQSIAPDEEIARKMRVRIVGLSTMHFIRESRPVKGFRVPGFSGMAIFLGSALTTTGLLLGNMHNLTGIGGSMLALALGIRFYLRPIK